ncbi:MAG: RraA family protein [Pseudomonadota bacterium]
MTPELLDRLRKVDTPTVCNAIEVVQGGRGFDRFTRGTMQHSDPGKIVVGQARTAKISGANPPIEDDDTIQTRRVAYYENMAGGDGPTIAVVEDLDYPHAIAGWWGEVHTAVHKGLGLSGALTNGVMRDLDVMEPDFPVLAGSIGVSHAFVHVREVGTPVSIFGLDIAQDEWVHADRHGALVIPDHVLPDLLDGIETVIRNEAIIIGPAREPGFDIDALKAAWAKFAKVRT